MIEKIPGFKSLWKTEKTVFEHPKPPEPPTEDKTNNERVSIDIVTWARSTHDWSSLYDVFCHLLSVKRKIDKENQNLLDNQESLQNAVEWLKNARDGLAEENRKLKEEIENTKIALEQEKFTCQNTFNHWQKELVHRKKLSEDRKILSEALEFSNRSFEFILNKQIDPASKKEVAAKQIKNNREIVSRINRGDHDL